MKIARLVSLLCVVLLIPRTASAATRTWTGAGGNSLWSNAANWEGGVAPKNGDDLVFGGQSSTTNDLDGLLLSSVTVTSGSPTFNGSMARVGALHVAGGALRLTSSPFMVTTSDTSPGATLALQQAVLQDATAASGTLEVTSDHGASQAHSVALGPAAQFAADLFDPSFWSTQIDYLVATGDVSLGGSSLVLHRGTGSPAKWHTLIRNEGPNPVNGTFQGLPEGAIFFQSQFAYRITYRGGSSGRDVAVVLLVGTNTWLASTRSPSAFGTPITLLAGISGGWGLNAGIPTGTMEFFDGATSLGTVELSNGEARLNTYALSPGSHVLTAHYSGGGFFGPNTSTTPLIQNVTGGQIVTATMLSGSSASVFAGQKFALTASVSTAGFVPSGTVTFFDGDAPLGTKPLDGAGKATLETSLPSGMHSLYANYDGSQTFYTSRSNTLTAMVDPSLLTQTALTVSMNPALAGTPIMVHATVLAPSGLPQGSVAFLDGATTLGTANVDASQTASLAVATLTPGLHTLTASYLGATGFSASTSAPIEQRIVSSASDCAPVIVSPPVDTTLSPDGSATLTVGTDSGQPETFQWYVGSYPDTSHPASTSAIVTLRNLGAPTDVWVLITNGCGSTHASAHVSGYVPSRRRAARH